MLLEQLFDGAVRLCRYANFGQSYVALNLAYRVEHLRVDPLRPFDNLAHLEIATCRGILVHEDHRHQFVRELLVTERQHRSRSERHHGAP